MRELDFEADRDLVRRAIAQDADALREIVDRHKDSVYRLAYRLTGDAETAQDIAQETFLKVFQRLDSVERGRALSHWIRTIARNLVKDRWRTKKDSVPFEEDHPSTPNASIPGPQQNLENLEIGERIQAALMRLSDANREAFVLKYVDELSYEEVAEVLGISASAAKVRAHRACKSLQGLLGEIRPYPENRA